MKVADELSLSRTIDNINQAQFNAEYIPASEQARAAKLIAKQQGLPGSYRGLFAPLREDDEVPFVFYTGETVSSWAGCRHVMGEEALRVLLLLKAGSRFVEDARMNAEKALTKYLLDPENNERGMYCCGQCSVSVWRVIAVGGYSNIKGFAERGVRTLKTYRDGKGRWRRFPFWYTVLGLSELNSKVAIDELRYCAPSLERSLKRSPGEKLYQKRRFQLAERVLADV